MPYPSNLINELNALLLFNPSNPQDGIKVHHDADPEMAAAVKSLFDKGMVTQVDGGYLTDLGQKAAERAEDLLTMMH